MISSNPTRIVSRAAAIVATVLLAAGMLPAYAASASQAGAQASVKATAQASRVPSGCSYFWCR